MPLNSALEVFRGGWDQLEHAIFTDNETTITGADAPISFFIKPDGTELYLLSNDEVETYPLAIPYDPNSVGSLIRSFLITDDTAPIGLNFKDDGTKMFVGGGNSKIMLEFAVPVPFDTDSIVASSVQISLSDLIGPVIQSRFSRDGDFFFVTDIARVYSFPLPTPWDITSNVSNSFITPASAVFAIAFKREGDKMYTSNTGTDLITEFDLSTPYDISTAVTNGNTLPIASPLNPVDIIFRSNGIEFYAFDIAGPGQLRRYHLDDQWDISTASLFSNSFGIADTNSVVWKPDGTRFFGLVASASDRIDQYLPPNKWNVMDTPAPTTFVLSGISADPRGFWWNRDGTRCFIVDDTTAIVIQLNLATGYDISTMSDPSIVSPSLSPALSPEGIAFTNDELTFYIMDAGTQFVYQFSVPTPLDIANAVYTGNSFLIVPAGVDTDIRLSTDERFFYLCDRGNELVKRYSLPADGNISNAAFLDSLDISALETNIRGIYIRETDGKKLYIVGQSANAIITIDMTLEFNNALTTELGEDLATESGETLVFA